MTDTMKALSDAQRELERLHKEEQRVSAAKTIEKVAAEESWPNDDRREVLLSLGLTVEPDTDPGSCEEPGSPRLGREPLPRKRLRAQKPAPQDP